MTEPAVEPELDDAPDDAPDDLPSEADATWDETTQETLVLLRGLRRRHRQDRIRETAYWSYVATLAVLIYVVPYVARAVRGPQQQVEDGAPAGVIPGAVAVALLVLVALVRDGLWRGPVLLDPAAATWLLPLPIRRETLLRPRLHRALAIAGLLGSALGAVAGVLVRLAAGGPAPVLAVTGAAAGGVLLVLGVALGAVVETADGATRAALRRVGTALWLLPAIPAGLALLPAHDATSRSTATGVLLWSGPWGWALQPLAAALPNRAADGSGGVGGAGGVGAGSGAAWLAALVALAAAVAVTAATVVVARRRVAAVPNRLLRARAATVTAVTQSLGTLQPRRARLLVESAQGRAPDTRRRLPVPRRRSLLLPWRDATALLRSPSRLVWGLIWIAVAAPLAAAAGGEHGLRRLEPGLAALVAGYLAVAQLVEGSRLDADDPRTVRSLPLSIRHLVLGHVVTPLALLAGATGLAVPVLAALGPAGWRPAAAVTLLAAALPALAGAALVSAFRGDVPLGLLAGGAPSPTGDPGPLIVVLWYVRGPLGALVLLLPLVLGGSPTAPAVVAAVAMLAWATARARKVLR